MNFGDRVGCINTNSSTQLTQPLAANLCRSQPYAFPSSPSSLSASSRYPPMQHPESDLPQIIAKSQTPQAALLELTRVLGEAFAIDGCMIALQSSDRSPLKATDWQPHKAAVYSSERMGLLTHPTIAASLNQTNCLAIADLEPDQQESSHSMRSVLLIKTQFQGRNNGVIALMRSHSHQWTELEMQELQAASETVAVAIAQVQLEEQLQRQIQYQSLIDQLSEAIRATWELEQIFRLTVEHTVAALQVSRGLVLLLKYVEPLQGRNSPQPIARITVAWEGTATGDATQLQSAPTNSSQTFWLSDCSLCQHVYTTKTVLATSGCPSAPSDPVQNFVVSPDLKTAAVFDIAVLPALLLVPLIHQNTLLGFLALQHHQPCRWQPEELAFVRLVATQLNTAIVQAQTFRQVQALVDKRTAQLQRSLDVQAKLYEKTRQQIEQLRHLNQLKDEFLSTLSHELLTPLTSMALAIRMLRQAELPPERRMTYLDILEQQCAQETNLINDLLALQRLSSRSIPLQLQKIDLAFLIRNLAQTFEESWAKKRLKLAIDLPQRSLTIHSNLDNLNRIFTELLSNAGKYAAPDTTVHLKATHSIQPQSGQVIVILCNRGAAIPAEEMPYIFDKFRRGQGVTQQAIPGTGLGLALVKGLVEHLNGSIAAASHPLEQSFSEQSEDWETCFTLTLPQFLKPDTDVLT